MNDVLTGLLDAVQSVDPVLRTVLAGIAIMLETSVLVGLIVPGDTIVIVAATAVSSVTEGVVLGAVVFVGALVGETIGFWLGRYLGPPIRHSRFGAWIGERNWTRAEGYLRRRGGPAIFLSRFLPVLHSLVPLTVGMSRMGYGRFLAWTAPACAIWSVAYVSVAAAAADTYRELSDRLHWAGYAFVAVIVVFLAGVWIVKRVIARAEARHLSVGTGEDVPD